jgi:glutamine cyclotransferase
MDDDFEMVERRAGHGSDLFPAERVLVLEPLHKRFRKQNCFLGVGILSLLIVVTMAVVGFYKHDEREQIGIDNKSYEDEGSNGGELDKNGDNGDTNSDPFANIQNGKDVSDIEDMLDNPGESPTEYDEPPVQSGEVEKWLNATVKLSDGPMFEIVAKIAHSRKSFTEGLTYSDGVLYESIGLNGQSSLLVLDAFTGTTKSSFDIDAKYFGEGLTYMNGKLVQLTWKSGTGFVYDTDDLAAKPSTFQFSTTRNEGWGITYDSTNDELIVSDGSEYLHFWDPVTMQEKRKVEVVRQNSVDSGNINELEFWRGKVLANIWYEDTIIVIDPETGVVEKEYGKNL